jgi:hypothetical protein
MIRPQRALKLIKGLHRSGTSLSYLAFRNKCTCLREKRTAKSAGDVGCVSMRLQRNKGEIRIRFSLIGMAKGEIDFGAVDVQAG